MGGTAWHRVPVEAGKAYLIQAGSNVDLKLAVLGAEPGAAATYQDLDNYSGQGESAVYLATGAGYLYFLVHNGDRLAGDYSVRVTLTVAPSPTPAPLPGWTTLQLGVATAAYLASSTAIDSFRVPVLAGRSYVVYATGFDEDVALLGNSPDGSVSWCDCDYSGSSNTRSSWTASADGFLYFKFKSHSGSYGSYTVTASEEGAASPTPPPTPPPGSTVSDVDVRFDR